MNNQMQGINVVFTSPFIYGPSPPQSSSQDNQKNTPISNIQLPQIPVGTNNFAYSVIPMIYPQQGIYPNQPLFFSNGIIPNQQSQIIYYQVVDGKLAPLSQVNFVPINQIPIEAVKKENNNDKNKNNETKDETFSNKNLNVSQNINAIPIQIMQMQNFNQNMNNYQINQPLIQNKNNIIINNNLPSQNNKKELFIPKETNNENKELKKVEKKVIFNLNNINKSTKIKLKVKKNNDNNINISTSFWSIFSLLLLFKFCKSLFSKILLLFSCN